MRTHVHVPTYTHMHIDTEKYKHTQKYTQTYISENLNKNSAMGNTDVLRTNTNGQAIYGKAL